MVAPVAHDGTAGGGGAGGPTILVVEDEPAVRDLVREILRAEGYVVEVARDGVQAVQVLERRAAGDGAPAVVLLDMMLPRLDGVGVLRHLADHGPHVPVIAMSANRLLLDAALGAGACSALPKPFELDDLVTVVEQHCSRRAG